MGPADFDERFKERLERISRPPLFGEWRVIFIDEAHTLHAAAFDALLQWVEDPPERVVYCFATTEIGSIPPALRSRLALLEIRPLDAASAIHFLRQVANKEGIDCDSDALALLAGLAEGQPRDLLARLDQLRHLHPRPPFKVTRDDVRAHFGVGDTEKLVDYFSALAEGDMGKQTELMLVWNKDPRQKLKLVQLFLLALYYNDLLQLDVIVDPVIASIRVEERRPIVDAFRFRIESKGIELNVFWREMIAFWPVVMPDQNETSIMLHFALFHRFVSGIDDQVRSNDTELSIGAASLLRVALSNTPKRKRPEPQRRRPKIEPDPAYLDYDQVKNIVNTASFCVQAYGDLFNVRMTLWHRAFKRDDAASAAHLMSEFVKELGYRVGYRLEGPVCRYSLQEHDKAHGFCARTIVHVPEANIDRLRKWVETWRKKERAPGFELEAIESQFCERPRTQGKRRAAFHAECVRWLCGGLNPKEKAWDTKEKRWKPLIELLCIPPKFQREAGLIGGQKRWSTSKDLAENKLAHSTDNHIPFLPAFDVGAWEQVAGNWELDEHYDRQKTIDERRLALDAISARYAVGTEEARKAAVDDLFNSWPDDPYARRRTWEVWWESMDT
jgi:DNA polymerase-3 subunit gamma/tau